MRFKILEIFHLAITRNDVGSNHSEMSALATKEILGLG